VGAGKMNKKAPRRKRMSATGNAPKKEKNVIKKEGEK
jgi:hypothetical protein